MKNINKQVLKSYIKKLNYQYKGDFIVESYKVDIVEIYGNKSKNYIIRTKDIDNSYVNHIVPFRDLNLFILSATDVFIDPSENT